MSSIYQQLITTEQLSQIITQANLVILDASIPPIGNVAPPQYSWPKSVIANARQFNLKTDFSDLNNPLDHMLPSSKNFEESARQLGINQDSQIVIYDHLGLYSAPRAWWMFKAMGHKNVAVLHGGLPKWIKEHRPVNVPLLNDNLSGNFTANLNTQYFCGADYVEQQLSNIRVAIIDARAKNRYLGSVPEPREGMRSGHIPNSVNLPYTELISDGEFVDEPRLRELFGQLIMNNQSLIMSCGSGITACVLALAADIIGYTGIRVYDGSWSEWGANSSLPITSGSKNDD